VTFNGGTLHLTAHSRVRFSVQPPRSLPARIFLALLVIALAVLAFFFFVVLLIAAAIVAAVFLARWWWLSRKVRKARRDSAIDGEYVVVESSAVEADVSREREAPHALPRDSERQG
jgi:hypothetical protein